MKLNKSLLIYQSIKLIIFFAWLFFIIYIIGIEDRNVIMDKLIIFIAPLYVFGTSISYFIFLWRIYNMEISENDIKMDGLLYPLETLRYNELQPYSTLDIRYDRLVAYHPPSERGIIIYITLLDKQIVQQLLKFLEKNKDNQTQHTTSSGNWELRDVVGGF